MTWQRVRSLVHDSPTVRVDTIEVRTIPDLIEARQAGYDAAMTGKCARLIEAAQLTGFRTGFAQGAVRGFVAAVTGFVLGILLGAFTTKPPAHATHSTQAASR